jgi:hypothetical protein
VGGFLNLLKERTNPNENWADRMSAATQGLSGDSIPKKKMIVIYDCYL